MDKEEEVKIINIKEFYRLIKGISMCSSFLIIDDNNIRQSSTDKTIGFDICLNNIIQGNITNLFISDIDEFINCIKYFRDANDIFVSINEGLEVYDNMSRFIIRSFKNVNVCNLEYYFREESDKIQNCIINLSLEGNAIRRMLPFINKSKSNSIIATIKDNKLTLSNLETSINGLKLLDISVICNMNISIFLPSNLFKIIGNIIKNKDSLNLEMFVNDQMLISKLNVSKKEYIIKCYTYSSIDFI